MKFKEFLLRKSFLAGLFIALLVSFWFSVPDPLFKTPTSFVIESAEGELLNASIAADGQWRFPASYKVPEKFQKCIVAFEDKSFYQHIGINPLSIARALKQNFKRKKIVSGASTLDMQLIRLATRYKRNFFNKLLEAIKAVRLNIRYSKDEILSLYAANAPFGSNVVGLEAASWRYFGREPSKLSWGEMASLAVLPNAPSLVHPGKNRSRLLNKRNRLIDILVSEKVLSQIEGNLAKSEPLPNKPFALPALSPHLINLAKSDYKRGKVSTTRIRTSVKSTLQRQVAGILDMHHKRLMANQVNNCAALVIDVESGSVLAYIGNIYQPKEAEIESHVDVIQARRSPGSTLKPFLYAAMLNEGMILPNSLVPDIPTQIAGYQPNNYDLGYDGAVPASRALARSLNVPAVRMLQQYRYERFHNFLKNLGITSLHQPPDFYGLSLILGGCEVSMWELCGIYASMARVLNHYNYNGKYNSSDWRSPSYHGLKKTLQDESSTMLNAASIYYTFQAMNEVMRPGEELLWKQFAGSQQIAWKTGTSFGFRDAWAVGVTPKYVVTVWAGNTDGEGRPGLTGIDAAGPVLFDIFRLLPAPQNGWFASPSHDMKTFQVCEESGFKASTLCTNTQLIRLPPAAMRAPVCNFHQTVHLDLTGHYQVNSECESPSNMIHRSWFVLPPVMEYYYKTKNYTYKALPPFREGCNATEIANMELIYPKNNARVYIPKGIDGKQQQVIFQVAHRKSGKKVYWHLDNTFLGLTRDLHQMALLPAPGKHIITLVDEEGLRLQQTFTVLAKEEL
ncbi:penicillin-binding protein 1C [Desertivirga brevis]|uniref:penicillin-binding protein 1C n=1 Tax=Desertivirga brevis TaxID=2810310 RepID=UPI001F62327F|nr:penicillin-binding protein 1C [Pedobacter sp. SYSU D00873]